MPPYRMLTDFDPGSAVLPRSDFVEVMEMLDKRLNDKGKNWRHVFKVIPAPSLPRTMRAQR